MPWQLSAPTRQSPSDAGSGKLTFALTPAQFLHNMRCIKWLCDALPRENEPTTDLACRARPRHDRTYHESDAADRTTRPFLAHAPLIGTYCLSCAWRFFVLRGRAPICSRDFRVSRTHEPPESGHVFISSCRSKWIFLSRTRMIHQRTKNGPVRLMEFSRKCPPN